MRATRYWIGAVGSLSSIIGLAFGIGSHGPGPRELWIIVAYAGIAFAGVMVWLEERDKTRRERNRKKQLQTYLLDEYVSLIDADFKRRVHGNVIARPEDRFLLQNIRGDEETLQRAIPVWWERFHGERRALSDLGR